MTQRTPQQVRAEAIGWHLRLRDGAAEEWESFVRWLEEDPGNSDAFDAVQAADAAATQESIPVRGRPEAANDDLAELPPRRGWSAGGYLRFGAGALVASLLLLIFVWPGLGGRGADRYEVATVAGQHRTIDLGEGSAVALNGETRLVLDRNNPRSVELASGEATFSVRHRDGEPFTVVASDHRIQDVGTHFNVVSEPGRFEVAVLEGSVLYDPDGARRPVGAGEVLMVGRDGRAVLRRDDPARLAGWQNGRLNYTSAPLAIVASDLSRSLGSRIRIAPGLQVMPFTGSIRIAGNPGATLRSFAATLGLQVRQEGNGWLIEPLARAPR